MLARKLQSAGAVQHRVFLGDDVVAARLVIARRRSVSLLVRPSRIATVRRTCSQTSGSWVTTTTVTPEQLVDRAEHLEHVVAVSRVELAGRLVGQQHGGLVGQRDRDGHALLLAAGQLGRAVLRAVGQARPGPAAPAARRGRARGTPSRSIGSSTFSWAVR